MQQSTIFAISMTGVWVLGACGGGPPRGDADAAVVLTPDARVRIMPDADPEGVPRLEAAPCRFRVPDSLAMSEGADYVCGDLVVYEDRDGSSGRTVVHYIQFTGADTGNASIYLDGGPGGNGENMLGWLGFVERSFFDGLLQLGDFLILAQRGTSLSRPSLMCPDRGDCGNELSFIADLPAYNTGYNADDVDDLRAQLGYAKLNLYGISYGSRLALEVLRRHGDNVRAAVIDGNVPAQVNWPAAVPSSFYSALTALNASCSDDASCAAAFGNLVNDFIAGVDTLEAEALTFNYEGEELWIDGATYASILFSAFYSNRSIPWLPILISDLADRRTDRVRDFLGNLIVQSGRPSGIAFGMYYSVVCGELFNPPDETAFDTANADVPAKIRSAFSTNWPGMLVACSEWPTGLSRPELSAAVASDVPTFVGNGTMDPITPPSFGDIAAATLLNKVVALYQHSGHGATLQTACGRRTMLAYLTELSAPDLTCADELPANYVISGAARGAAGFDRKRLTWELRHAPIPPSMRETIRRSRTRTH